VTYFDELRDGAAENFREWLRALAIMAVVVAERGIPEAERETRRRDRIVVRIRRGDWDEKDISWLQERAALMSDAEVMSMAPFDSERIVEISRHVARASTPQVDFWTRREIPAGAGDGDPAFDAVGLPPRRRRRWWRDGAPGGQRRVYRHGELTTY
jgi:hypothetical protein